MHIFPPEFVYVYGLTNTLFIVVIYVPIYYVAHRKGYELMTTLNPFQANEVEAWQKQQGTWEDFLKLKITLVETIRVSFFLLAPFIGSVLSALFE
ncbi:MAG: hypothetical protein HC880_04880 [Bacteroidia bacterium]|nr:hypothetical protein [Bacteroidia bacterium]